MVRSVSAPDGVCRVCPVRPTGLRFFFVGGVARQRRRYPFSMQFQQSQKYNKFAERPSLRRVACRCLWLLVTASAGRALAQACCRHHEASHRSRSSCHLLPTFTVAVSCAFAGLARTLTLHAPTSCAATRPRAANRRFVTMEQPHPAATAHSAPCCALTSL